MASRTSLSQGASGTGTSEGTRPGEVNSAVRNNLDRVIRHERQRTTRILSFIRLGTGILSVLPSFFIDRTVTADFDPMPTVYGSAVYFCTSLLNFLLVVVLRRGVTVSIYWLALVDVPLVACIEWFQAGTPRGAQVIPPVCVALMMALLSTSTLTLSRPAIAATSGVTLLSMVMVLVRCGLPPPTIFFSFVGLSAVAALSISLVGRIRSLLAEARQRDLLGKYVLGERLGLGGMAEVFKATYSPEGGFERQVALKRILPAYAELPDSVAMFRREAELGARLAHPNIVQVLDFGADGQSYFLAMEFVDGISLGRLVAWSRERQRPLPMPVVVWVASSLVEALDYIQQLRDANGAPMHLVHRDLNPPNVLLSRVGEVKLADFGIARAVGAEGNTRTGALRGKLGYFSPEQIRGEAYDGRADLFSLGATVFETITGQRLFQASNEAAAMKIALESTIAKPSTKRPDVSPELDAFVMGLLERDPARRSSTSTAKAQLQHLGRADWLDFGSARTVLAELVNEVMRQSPSASAMVPISSTSATSPASAHDAPTGELHAPEQ